MSNVDINVDRRTDGLTDGRTDWRTDGRTDGKSDAYIAPCYKQVSKWLTSIVHILSQETDNCPSWISGRERMTVENISRSISTKECCPPPLGLNPHLLVSSRTAHPTEPPRPASSPFWKGFFSKKKLSKLRVDPFSEGSKTLQKVLPALKVDKFLLIS